MRFTISNLGGSPVQLQKVEFNLSSQGTKEDENRPPQFTADAQHIQAGVLGYSVDLAPWLASVGVDVEAFRERTDSGPRGVRLYKATGTTEDLTEEEYRQRMTKALGPFPEAAAKMSGRILYINPADGAEGMVRFATTMFLVEKGATTAVPVASQSHYNVQLDPVGRNYTRPINISQGLKVGEFDRFTIRIACPRSSAHRFRIRLLYNGNKYIDSPPISLTLFNPSGI